MCGHAMSDYRLILLSQHLHHRKFSEVAFDPSNR